VDRKRKEITVRFDNGARETLQLTDCAAADVGKDLDQAADGTRVAVYYSDDQGKRIVHYFKKK